MIKKILVVFMLLTVVLTGCGKEKEVIEDKTEVVDLKPDFGGEMNIAIDSIDNPNPILVEGKDMEELLDIAYERLFDYDAEGKIIPVIAKNLEVSDSGYIYTFDVNEEVKWANGESVSAEDVIYTLDQIKASEESIYNDMFKNIAYYKITEDGKVKISYKDVLTSNMYELNIPIINKGDYKIGSGQYTYDGGTYEKELNFVRNENYYKGKPYIEKIRVIEVSDEKFIEDGLKHGEIDFVKGSLVNYTKFLNKDKYKIDTYKSNLYDFMAFNFKNKLLSIPEVRKSIEATINRETIIKSIYGSFAEEAISPIYPKWLVTDLSDNNVKVNSKEVLKEYGFEDYTGDGILEYKTNGKKSTLRFKILVNEENGNRMKVAEYVKSELRKIGIETEIVAKPFEEYSNDFKRGNFDIVLGGWELSMNPDLTALFNSKVNKLEYKSEKVDALLKDAYTVRDLEELRETYSSIEFVLNDEIPYIDLVFRNKLIVRSIKVKGELEVDNSKIYKNIYKLYINEK
ncbi:MAG: ABC transporter substrate-binding protein [Clostridia bacterium]|nr:ABC transporter substrate-binding protein [Clostridia bacterium]